ncbi:MULTISPECIES: 1,4-alpha-glucan branching protein GlgB [unclassified Mesorhizobium]|uniref:1,4-alpha-glucan branching protein GlgB n=1 Tax=unclassified Mesorhizobium TaxID=325217 RepID=UPI000FCAE696|nr:MULTISPECIES: 1,4-alpha-glucan branching protein GlgB [unclassified Mesorhizobium]RUW35808.1 1,4-alpha-glucan branching protein GlgB [Mesorhizobium sp. M1E.F.Ca.ET.041.01.1.1]RUW84306.1 1,4-alpha-glucan branching protein GlgB [Mesorhizobium sp. M1E.F.Ca.ET.063.01.1.1]RWD89869.1 MAG: 1,4-alpha-glucan branching protein GlgB [Mesorhizobium sp.]RWD95885.1 MAG: 1,4-alpha-glucan branching protein GlgB [Mesorhizobium sp.]TIV55833.1 MAG: 1,4-alpha-glucan branching protein GlgB [Mesorhizobium sp.]
MRKPRATAATSGPDGLAQAGDVAAIVAGTHGDPFAVLGVHEADKGFVARCFVPNAEFVTAYTLTGKEVGQLIRSNDAGFFEGRLSIRKRQPLRYHARNAGGDWWLTDPYSFGPVLGPMDDYYMAEGSHLRLFDKLGAHIIEHEGATGVHFAVWAPNARRVSVVGAFNDWDGRRHTMRDRKDTGIWELFIPDLRAGQPYKFEIIGPDGVRLPLKADPFAFESEMRPATASVTAPPMAHQWGDEAHHKFWQDVDPRREAISIYEVHAGSWQRRDDGTFLTWDELAARLIPYVVDAGFTHIEFLPVSEHPYDPSWGYQTTGLYAPTARFGDPDGFARFVDGAHRAGVGVILDWVPAHFPVDEHGLVQFDGTALYEHADPRQGFHPDWNTAIYNFGRREVVSFLVNNALFWAEKYHVDGLRVDAVASMLYLDYSRKAGEWIPNEKGGRENLQAVSFLQKMNKELYGHHPGVMTIAEESTSWPKVSRPVHEGGLGFGFKWNMGFMHDTLEYLSKEPIFRKHHHNDITFGLTYAFSENFVLPLSHDEVVHGKGTLLHKMAGDDWQKFATLRAYYAFMWGYPGKKLLFMGQEFAQRREWSEARALDWNLLDYAPHRGVWQTVRDLNYLYRSRPALHARDCEPEGFSWLIVDDRDNSVFAWLRSAPDGNPIAVISNFTPVPRENYRVPLPKAGEWREIMNTDAAVYGGSGMGNGGRVAASGEGGGTSATMLLPPLSTIMLEFVAD